MSDGKLTKIFVDFSLSVGTGAFGKISGALEVPLIPQTGDCISFEFCRSDNSFSQDAYIFRVENRVIAVGRKIEDTIFLLNSISVDTPEAAEALMSAFEVNYGLFGETYEL